MFIFDTPQRRCLYLIMSPFSNMCFIERKILITVLNHWVLKLKGTIRIIWWSSQPLRFADDSKNNKKTCLIPSVNDHQGSDSHMTSWLSLFLSPSVFCFSLSRREGTSTLVTKKSLLILDLSLVDIMTVAIFINSRTTRVLIHLVVQWERVFLGFH